MLLLLSGAALTGLIKQTFLTLGIAVVFVISIDQVWRRRPPLIAIFYLACTLGFWLLAGQAPQNIGSYLINAAQIVKGFSATMGTPGAIADCILYILTASSFVGLVASATYRHRRRLDLLPVAVLALVLFLAFKGAFVRHDSGHAVQAAMTSIPFACLYSALLWPEICQVFWRVKRLKVAVPIWLVTWALLLFNAQFLWSSHGQNAEMTSYPGMVRKTGLTFNTARLSLLEKKDRQAVYQSSLAAIRANNPLPPLSGTTDLYPNEAAIILAYGLPYRPRPVIQSFSAYTGHLAEINAAHLRSDDAPETVLFDVRAIDERLPSSEDGLSWPELLTRYDIADTTGKYWVLKRRATAQSYSLTPIESTTAALGDWVEMPAEKESAIWMQIDARPGLVGKLTTTLFKLPPLFLEVALADGRVERRRVLADVLNSGQLLSPLVLDRSDFLYFAAQGWPKILAGSRVQRMRLVAEGWGELSYPDRYELSFSRFEFLPQDLSGVPGWQRLSGLAALKQGETISAQGHRLESRTGPNGKLVLRAHADTRVVVPLTNSTNSGAGADPKLQLSYGILDEAWQEAQASDPSLFENQTAGEAIADGVEFRVLAIAPNGQETVLFSRWLDPHANERDRGEKTVEIDLSTISAEKLALETLSGPTKNSRWDWSYWSSFELSSATSETSEVTEQSCRRRALNRKRLWPKSMAAKLLLAGLYVGPLAALVWFVASLGVNVPRIDQWFLLDLFEQVHRGEASFADFFAQFHEHRMLVPRLVFVGLAFATDWNIYYELGLNVAIAAITFWLILQVALNTISRDNTGSALPFHVANISTGLLVFSWTQYQNWLWGFQIPWFFINACLIAVILVLVQNNLALNRKLLVAAVLCGLASFSSAHGLFVWIAVLPSLVAATSKRTRLEALLIWVGLFVICLLGYFANYQKPAVLATDYMNSVSNFLGFFFVSMSVPIAGQPVEVTTRYVQSLMGLGVLVFLLFCGLAFYSASRYSPVNFSVTAPWLSIGLFSIVFALANSYGRSGEGINQALQSRYITPGLLIVVAIIQLLSLFSQSGFTRLNNSVGRKCRWLLIVATSAFGMLHFGTYAAAFENAVYGDQHHAHSQRKEAVCVELIHYMSEQGLAECFLRDQQGSKEKVLRLNAIGLRASPDDIEFVEPDELADSRLRQNIAIAADEQEVTLSGWATIPSDIANYSLLNTSPEAVLLSVGDEQRFVAVGDRRSLQLSSGNQVSWAVEMRTAAFKAISATPSMLSVYFYYPKQNVFFGVGKIPLDETNRS